MSGFLGGQFLIALAFFLGNDLLGAILGRVAKCPEKKSDQHATYRGVEDGVGQVFASEKAYDKSEQKADKASYEREVLHGRRVGVRMRYF